MARRRPVHVKLPERRSAAPKSTADWLMRLTQPRAMLFVALVIGVAAFLEYGVIRPFFGGWKLPTPPTPAGAGDPTATAGRLPVRPLGDRARVLQGLREVVPAHLPATALLAPGSAAAQAAQVACAEASGLPVEVVNSIGMHFRLMPPGRFVMGSPVGETGRWEGEAPHDMEVTEPFYIGACEVTQGQWLALMPRNPAYFKDEGRPVEELTWPDAQAFADALSQREGLPPSTYRLASEAEWEYACRAGTATSYCFGDDAKRLKSYADYAGNNGRRTNRVGCRLPNAFGLYDMHGNVYEWCLDRYTPYPEAPPAPPLPEGDWRVIRGGNWNEPAANCRSANRARLPPLSHGNMLGCRLVRTLGDWRNAPVVGDATARAGEAP